MARGGTRTFRKLFSRPVLGFAVILCVIIGGLYQIQFNDSDEISLDKQDVKQEEVKFSERTKSFSTDVLKINTIQQEENLLKLEQQRRFHVLEEACTKHNISRSLPNFSERYTHLLLVDDEHHILFNFIPKVSSQTWKAVFSKLRGSNDKCDYRALNKYTQQEIEFRMKNYRKAVFVREPLTRLLSGFLSKLHNGHNLQKKWEDAYGKQIVKAYRQQNDHSKTNQKWLNINLTEFIQYITDNKDDIQMSQLSEHFLQFYKVASPCAMNYDFIGHYENLTTEGPYMLKYFGVNPVGLFPEVHGSKASKTLIKQYQTVPMNLMNRLHQYYQVDYDLFGYSFSDTLNYIMKVQS